MTNGFYEQDVQDGYHHIIDEPSKILKRLVKNPEIIPPDGLNTDVNTFSASICSIEFDKGNFSFEEDLDFNYDDLDLDKPDMGTCHNSGLNFKGGAPEPEPDNESIIANVDVDEYENAVGNFDPSKIPKSVQESAIGDVMRTIIGKLKSMYSTKSFWSTIVFVLLSLTLPPEYGIVTYFVFVYTIVSGNAFTRHEFIASSMIMLISNTHQNHEAYLIVRLCCLGFLSIVALELYRIAENSRRKSIPRYRQFGQSHRIKQPTPTGGGGPRREVHINQFVATPVADITLMQTSRYRDKGLARNKASIQPHELKVSATSPRPYIQVDLANGRKQMCLVDTGASSNCVRKSIVDDLIDEGINVPFLKTKYAVRHVGSDSPMKGLPVCLLTIRISPTHEIQDCPFIVMDEGADMIIGNNTLLSKRYSLVADDGSYYLGFVSRGRISKEAQVYLKTNKEFELRTSREIAIMPGQVLTVETYLPDVPDQLKSNLGYRSIHVTPNHFSNDCVLESVSLVQKHNKVKVRLCNTTKEKVIFPENSIVAEARVVKDTFLEDCDAVDIHEMYNLEKKFSSIQQTRANCSCGYHNNEKTSAIVFCDKYGTSYFNSYELLLNTSFNEIPSKSEKVRRFKQFVQIMPDHEGSFKRAAETLNNVDSLSKLLPGQNVTVLAGASESFSPEQMEIITSLAEYKQVRVVRIRNDGECQNCSTIANGDLIRLRKGTNSFKIVVSSGKNQVHPHEARVDRDSDKLVFHYFGGSKVVMYTSQSRILVFIHVVDPHRSDHYVRNLVYCILEHLRRQKLAKTLSVFTDEWRNKNGFLSKQTSYVLHHLQPFEIRSQVPNWVHEPKSNILVQVPYYLEDCDCEACDAIFHGETVICKPLQLILDGQIENLEQNIRVPRDASCAEAVVNFLRMDNFGSPEDWEACGIKSEHYDKATSYPHTLEPEDWQQFVSRDWRITIKEDSIPLPMRDKMILALDEYAPQYFSHCAEYRYMNIPPVKIETVKDFKPFIERSRFMPPSESEFLDDKLSEMLSIGNVRIVSEHELKNNVFCISRVFCTHQNSTTARQELLAGGKPPDETDKGKPDEPPGKEARPPKKCERATSKKRLILDLRSINALTKVAGNETLIIKSVEEVIHRMHGAKYAICLDITKSFRSLLMDRVSSLLYCFQHPHSQKFGGVTFALTSCPDGARLSPTVLTSALTNALAGTEAFTISYMDDVLIFSHSYDQLVENFIEVSKRLIKLNALVNAQKCEIGVTEFVFLGHKFELNDGNVRYGVSEERKATFDLLKVPSSKHELQRVLGIICFVRSMVPGIFIIIMPLLYALRSRGNKAFHLDETQVKAFWLAVKALKNAQYNYIYSWEKEGSIICDASKWGYAAALIQLDDQNRPQIIKYTSKAFPDIVTSSKSSLYKETLSVYLSALEFEVFVTNSPRFCIYTDCSVLVYICANLVECRDEALSRLIHRIYNLGVPFRLKHVAAHSIGLADLYSREGFEIPSAVTGLPLHTESEIREYMQGFKIPDGWLDTNNYLILDDLVKEFQKTIDDDAKLSDNVKQKRKEDLNQRILESQDHPTEYLSSPSLKSNSNRTIHPLSTDVAMVEHHPTSTVEVAGVSPPCSFSTITPRFIYELQQADPECQWILRTFTTRRLEDLPKRLTKRYRVVDQSIILTKKKKGGNWILSNMRIYIPEMSVMKLMCILHLSAAHLAKNSLIAVYNRNFKSKNSAIYARLLITTCRTCQLYRRGHKSLPKSRIGHADAPGEKYYIDILDLGPGRFDNKTVRYLLAAVDSYSSMIFCQPMTDMKVRNVQTALELMFSVLPCNGSTIVSDNQNTLCGNPMVKQLLKNMNFKDVLTSSSYRSTSNGMVESALYKVRTGLAMNKETWKTRSLWDLLPMTILMINNRPLSRFCNSKDIVTPESLFYGTRPSTEVTERILAPLDDASRNRYRKRYDLLIKQWEKVENAKFEKAQKEFKAPYELVTGNVVLYENKVRKKASEPLYFKEIYEIVSVGKKRLEIKPLFRKTKPIWVSKDYVKPFVTSPLVSQLLPEDYQWYLGRSFDPNKLKTGSETPTLIERPNQYEAHNLRSRLSPQNKGAKLPVLAPKETDSMSWPSTSSSSSLPLHEGNDNNGFVPSEPQDVRRVTPSWVDPDQHSEDGQSSSSSEEYRTPLRTEPAPPKRVTFAVPEDKSMFPSLPGRYPDSPDVHAHQTPREIQDLPPSYFNPGTVGLGRPSQQSSPALQGRQEHRGTHGSPNTSDEFQDAQDTLLENSPSGSPPEKAQKSPPKGSPTKTSTNVLMDVSTRILERLGLGTDEPVPPNPDLPSSEGSPMAVDPTPRRPPPPPPRGSGRGNGPPLNTNRQPNTSTGHWLARLRGPSRPIGTPNTPIGAIRGPRGNDGNLGASPYLPVKHESDDEVDPLDTPKEPRRSKRTTQGVPPKRYSP